ncbi:unnamed protein product, partial [Staurois parvus]
HRWAELVGELLGTGGCTAGHRWAELVGTLLGTGGRNLWLALLGTDHQGTDRCHSMRKVLPITGNCQRRDRHRSSGH